MNIVRALFIGFICMWWGTQRAQDTFNAIKQIKQLLDKSEITPDDKSMAVDLLLALSSKKNDRNAVVAAEQLGPRWKIKLLGQACNKFDDLIAIIGQENYEKAIQGKNIDPMMLGEGSRQIVEELEQKSADLKKILLALEVETIDSAKKMISSYKKLQESPRDAKALDAEIASLNASIAQFKKDLATKKSELEVKEVNLKQLEAQEKAPTQTCDAMGVTRTQSYKAALGEKNFERLQHAVDQKIKNPAVVQEDLFELIKLEDFPSNSAIIKERQLIEQEIQETRSKLASVRQELSTLGKAPAAPKEPVRPQSIPIPPAPSVPEPVIPQQQNQPIPQPTPYQGAVEPAAPAPIPAPIVSGEPTQPEPAPTPPIPGVVEPPVPAPTPLVSQEPTQSQPAPEPTQTIVSDDCEKKLIKVRMVLNEWSDPAKWTLGLGLGAWYEEYLKPIVKDETWPLKIWKEVDPLGANKNAINQLSLCEQKIRKVQLVFDYYKKYLAEAEKDETSRYSPLLDRYINPILKGEDWSKSTGLTGWLGGQSDYDKIRDYNSKALSDPSKNTFGITKEQYAAIFGK